MLFIQIPKDKKIESITEETDYGAIKYRDLAHYKLATNGYEGYLYTISFLDPHGDNIFYDPESKKFSWIDLSTLGHSSRSYFDTKADGPTEFKAENLIANTKTPLEIGLEMLLYQTLGVIKLGRKVIYTRKRGTGLLKNSFTAEALDSMIEGYKSAFDGFPEEKKRLSIKLLSTYVDMPI